MCMIFLIIRFSNLQTSNTNNKKQEGYVNHLLENFCQTSNSANKRTQIYQNTNDIVKYGNVAESEYENC